jgi:hypothetical protein
MEKQIKKMSGYVYYFLTRSEFVNKEKTYHRVYEQSH